MNTGQALWREAKRIIPGGGQLLSKRAERFLPDLWPAYYARAKGCEVWDLDGNHYYDFAQMGVGSCALGYADPDVNAAVEAAVRDGSMCSLNAPEEVAFAKRLIGLHPWAEQARFARTGGEACAVAVRLARAASGKGRVAFCGYHGWSDWYLAANLSENAALDGHLLPGLAPAGVYRGLAGSALPFRYNELDDLERLFARYDDIGVVIMEPCRGAPPAPGFLEGVRAAVDRHGALLVFDEVTAAFRETLGGLHLKYGVEPDVAVFGKALGNGFPIAAVIGRRRAMEAAQETFVSSTMWTERVGFAAGLATLDKMERIGAPARLTAFGERVLALWRALGEKRGVPLRAGGLPALAHLAFVHDEPDAVMTLFAQEMLDRGFLQGGASYMTTAYTDEVLARYAQAVDGAFAAIRAALDAGDVRARLRGGVLQPGFARLT